MVLASGLKGWHPGLLQCLKQWLSALCNADIASLGYVMLRRLRLRVLRFVQVKLWWPLSNTRGNFISIEKDLYNASQASQGFWKERGILQGVWKLRGSWLNSKNLEKRLLNVYRAQTESFRYLNKPFEALEGFVWFWRSNDHQPL